MKKFAPATARNRQPLADVLAAELPASGLLLEIASGTGEHAVFFAERFSGLDWLPSDPDADARSSIAAWREEANLANLRAPMMLDAAAEEWPVSQVEAILCVNMVHISPVEATQGLMAGAGRILTAGAPLVLYGPYLESGVETAPSNMAFDHSLKARNPLWGLRDIDWIDGLATQNGLERTRRITMPANNLTLVYRRQK